MFSNFLADGNLDLTTRKDDFVHARSDSNYQ